MKSTVPKVLIVHNDTSSLRVLKDVVERTGADVSGAASGMTAAAMIPGGDYNLALIDMALPDMGGIELATYAANENVPALLLSDDQVVNTRLKQWGFPYLSIPMSASDLQTASDAALDNAAINILKVKASAARMLTNMSALRHEVADSHRLVEDILAKLRKSRFGAE